MQMVPGAQTVNFAKVDLHQTLLDMTGGSGPDVGVEAVGMHYTKSIISKVRWRLTRRAVAACWPLSSRHCQPHATLLPRATTCLL
jgi:NADPH:quinone reductase-like Zn-dependent oxidoreductase